LKVIRSAHLHLSGLGDVLLNINIFKVVENPKDLKKPDDDNNHHDNVQNVFDFTIHGDVIIDKV